MMGQSTGLVLGFAWVTALGCSKSSAGEQTLPTASSAAAASAAVAGPASSPAAAVHARARRKATCPDVLKRMDGMKAMDIELKATPGSWGKVPKELQVLPPGAQHCGSVDLLGQGVIVSSLSGKDMHAFYAPLFAKLSCEPLECEDVTSGDLIQTRCTCRADGLRGSISTSTGDESYVLSATEMSGLKKRK